MRRLNSDSIGRDLCFGLIKSKYDVTDNRNIIYRMIQGLPSKMRRSGNCLRTVL